jgi:hypothetical protein
VIAPLPKGGFYRENKPAPGQYNVNESLTKPRMPAHDFGSLGRDDSPMKSQSNVSVGPGAYYPDASAI